MMSILQLCSAEVRILEKRRRDAWRELTSLVVVEMRVGANSVNASFDEI